MAGGIAEAFYGVPDFIATEAYKRLDPALLEIVNKFKK
jgi:ADP-ribosylglycohydrolase